MLATVGLRSGSGANYELIQVVPEGSMVGVATCSAGWCATVWKGRRGYAPTSALSIAPASPDGTYPPYADEPVAYHGGSGDDDQRPNISVGAAFDITFGYGPHSRWRRRW